MTQFLYFPDTDTLEIDLTTKPATGGAMNAGWDGEDEDILLNVDDQGRIVSITIDRASKRVDLEQIKSEDRNIHLGEVTESFTVTGLARELNISRQAVLSIIKKMENTGHKVGKQDQPRGPIILSKKDAKAIEKWRTEHPNGRPASVNPKPILSQTETP